MARPPILVCGAGPTGLVLALGLARRGVAVRLIDDNSGPGEHSRAMAVHARTLEFYRQFGFADEVVAQGIASENVHLRERDRSGRSREVVRVALGQLGKGLSPYPFILTYPQDLHDRLLVAKLEAAGGRVEWNTRLLGFTQDRDGVSATLQAKGARPEEVACAYICGCDGAHSQVRQTLGVGFRGGTYAQPFYVADVRLAGETDTDLHVNLGQSILALRLPVRMSGMHRLIGLVPPRLADRSDLAFDDIRAEVEELIGARVAEVNWFSRYRVHHRVAERFRVGRAFLAGDAGHLHSPVGGQGMNTGIGDAINLGWKLAEVMRGRAEARLLDSYEPERIAFARTLVATTDRVFGPLVASGLAGEVVRRLVVPVVGVAAASLAATRRAAFRTVSQIRIAYPDSPLSEGKAGAVRAGDRLPWVVDGTRDNFEPLRSAEWQAHVYGSARPDFADAARALGLPLHVLGWSAAARKAGLQRDAVYVVRPDGHVGLAASAQRPDLLRGYLQRIGARLSAAPAREPTAEQQGAASAVPVAARGG